MNTKDALKLDIKIIKAFEDFSPMVLSKGWLRYEALRKLSPTQFAELHRKNIQGNDDGSKVTFDELVDELVVKGITE